MRRTSNNWRSTRGDSFVSRPPRTELFAKTTMCKFFMHGTCTKGSDCMFAHSKDELRDTPDLSKTRLCKAFEEGRCTNVNCNYAHSQEELREFRLTAAPKDTPTTKQNSESAEETMTFAKPVVEHPGQAKERQEEKPAYHVIGQIPMGPSWTCGTTPAIAVAPMVGPAGAQGVFFPVLSFPAAFMAPMSADPSMMAYLQLPSAGLVDGQWTYPQDNTKKVEEEAEPPLRWVVKNTFVTLEIAEGNEDEGKPRMPRAKSWAAGCTAEDFEVQPQIEYEDSVGRASSNRSTSADSPSGDKTPDWMSAGFFSPRTEDW